MSSADEPDAVLTHWNGSWHKDHQNCHLIVTNAVFYAGLDTLEREQARMQWPNSATRTTGRSHELQPDTFLDISSVYQKWMRTSDFLPMWRGQTGSPVQQLLRQPGSDARMRLRFFHAVALMSDAGQRAQKLRSL